MNTDKEKLEKIIKNVQNLIEQPETTKMLNDIQKEFEETELNREDISEWEITFFNIHPEPSVEALRKLFDKWLELLEYDVKKEKEYYVMLTKLILENGENVTLEILRLSALILLHKKHGISTLFLETIQYGAYALMWEVFKDYEPLIEKQEMVNRIFGTSTEPPKDLKDFLEGLRRNNG